MLKSNLRILQTTLHVESKNFVVSILNDYHSYFTE